MSETIVIEMHGETVKFEKYTIRVFNNRVTRNISGPKMNEVTGDRVKITYKEDS